MPIPEALIAIFVTGCMLILPYNQLIYFVFFLMPLMCGLPGYMMLVAWLFLLIKGKHINPRQIIPLLIISALEMINENLGDASVLTGTLSFLSFSAIFFYIVGLSKEINIDFKRCIFLFGCGVCFVFFVIYYNLFIQFDYDSILSGSLRGGALGGEDNEYIRG